MQSYIPLNPAMFDTLIVGTSYTIKRTYEVEKDMKEQKDPKEFETCVDMYTVTLKQALPDHIIPQLYFNCTDDNCHLTLSGAWDNYEIRSTD